MQKKAYTGVEIEVTIFKTEDTIVASGVVYEPESTGSNDTEIL